MKIAIIPGSCVPFHGKTLTERPLGGTETAIIRLAEALDRLGHKVFVFSRFEHPPVSKPLYLPLRAMNDVGQVDVLIAVRELLPLFTGIQARASFFWTGDSYDQLQHLGLGDRRVIQRLTALLAVSNWQADRLCAVSGYPRQRAWIMRNGHDPQLFAGSEARSPKRLIYSSAPYRGLQYLAPIFKQIKVAHPEAELHIFSGFSVYDGTGAQNEILSAQYEPLMKHLSTINGITVHGNVPQHQLARELMRSRILAYPNTFEETSCITAIEAQAAGCAVITSRRGALAETVGDAGILLDGDPASTSYQNQFAIYINNLFQDPEALQTLSERSQQKALGTTWDAIAHDFSERLRALFTTTSKESSNVVRP